MNKYTTIRERIERAAAYLPHQTGVVLTTFNLNADFLTGQALPTVLGVEATTPAAIEAETHQRLAATPCTVFYDPGLAPKLSGRFRFVARPVPIPGRFFHPKIVVIAGRDQDNITWVYLAISSANLTLSGWGRNAECFAETWIHTKRQQSWSALKAFLAQLQSYAPLEEHISDHDAVARVRAALNNMPDQTPFPDAPENSEKPWPGTLHARFYSSLTHPAGLADFLQDGRTEQASELRVYSPYWGDVARQVAAFNAQKTVLIPARRADGSSFGMARTQAEELPAHVKIQRNQHDTGQRFWHMKIYSILYQNTAFTAVGSCNFTHAGITGLNGNIEAALVFETTHSETHPDWLPDGKTIHPDELANELLPEEGAPEPDPILIVVAYDWRSNAWRWWLKSAPNQNNFQLHLPNRPPLKTNPGTHHQPGPPPARGATYKITYTDAEGPKEWEGSIVELNLDFSTRTYGRPLTANEILESWLTRATTLDLGGDIEHSAQEGEDDDASTLKNTVVFAAVNLYELYRSMRGLRLQLETLKDFPEAQRAHLVGRPNSVMALAHLATKADTTSDTASTVRYLVLNELHNVLRDWTDRLDPQLVETVRQMAQKARDQTHALLAQELGDTSKANQILDWFQENLAEFDEQPP